MEPDRLNVPLFRPYEKLIPITVRGRQFSVPENQILLRAFQYLSPDTIPYGRYCWNEECQYCRVSVVRPGGEKISQALSCKLIAEEGLEVTELAAELLWSLRCLLGPASPAGLPPASTDAFEESPDGILPRNDPETSS